MKDSFREAIPRLICAVAIAAAFLVIQKLHHLQEERALRFPKSNTAGAWGGERQ